MKKGVLKRLATKCLVDHLRMIKNDQKQHPFIRFLAMLLYDLDLLIFYGLAPCILGGFAYIYHIRENYIISICACFLFLCACIFTLQKCRKHLKHSAS